jgi:hypothetical protein
VHQQISIALFVASGQEEGGPFPSTLLVHIWPVLFLLGVRKKQFQTQNI